MTDDPTPATEAQRMSAGIEIGELIDDLKRERGFSDEAWKMFADAVAESHQAEFDNDRLRAENTATLDRATRAEQALAEAHKALAEISAGAIETLDFADRLYTSGRTGDDVLVEFETSAPAWRIREIKTLLALAAASTPAGATELSSAPCGCPRKPARMVCHTRECTLERHSLDFPLPDDMLDDVEPAPRRPVLRREVVLRNDDEREPHVTGDSGPEPILNAPPQTTVVPEPAAEGYDPTALTVEFPDAATTIAWLRSDDMEPPAPDEGARGDRE